MTTDHDHRPQVPPTVVDVITRDLRRAYPENSPVMRCAADVVAEVHRLDAEFIERLAERYGLHASPDFIAGMHAASRGLAQQDARPAVLDDAA